jgi:serine/threonine-protein kinase
MTDRAKLGSLCVVAELVGTKLDRFELIAELASGGMGTVYLARLGGAGGFQRLYAIKRLHEHLARHSEFIEMFLDEARLAARIHHPNVVPILEIGTTDAGYYLVMEYVEGDTAGHLFHCASQEGKVIPPRVSIRIVLDALAGLHAAHEGTDDEGRNLEIVHRDVSPHNVLVSVDGVSRITDFGIARAASRLAVTRTGQLKGKIAYMAPEQARSEKIDRRADVFAMGICLWEMLARRRLFKAEAEGETLNRLLYEPIPALRTVDPEIPKELEAIVVKALTRDLEQRYATAADFADALEDAARSLDLLGTHREVAATIADVLGPDLSERRADLRAWIADTERRSVLPPAESSGDLGMGRPDGAKVSVYVPPLFEAGLAGRARGLSPRELQARRHRRVLAAMGLAIVSLLGFGAWRHFHGVGARHEPAIVAAPAAGPPVTQVSLETEHAPEPATAEGPPEPESAPAATPASLTAVPPVPRPPAGAKPAGAVAVAKPTHASPGAPVSPETGPPKGAASVPTDMLYNPYR